MNGSASSALSACPTTRSRASSAGRSRELLRGRPRVVPPENLHVTLAFLGRRPAGRAAGDRRGAPRSRRRGAATRRSRCAATARRGASGCSPSTTRAARAAALAERLQRRLEALGVYRREARPWLPHVTVLRFRERPRLEPALPELGERQSVRRGCLHFQAASRRGASTTIGRTTDARTQHGLGG